MAEILILEDDDLVRDVLCAALERVGHSTREAPDVERAIALHRKVRPDLVIVDLLMPGRDGIQAIAELRERDSHARILAISGGGSEGLAHARALGADASLAKPFSLDQLESTVEGLLSGRQQGWLETGSY